jgi:hypothetical protein
LESSQLPFDQVPQLRLQAFVYHFNLIDHFADALSEGFADGGQLGMPAFRQFNTQSFKLGTQARALTGRCGLGRSSLLKLGLAGGAFSFTDGGH